jgi:hypothetical protein
MTFASNISLMDLSITRVGNYVTAGARVDDAGEHWNENISRLGMLGFNLHLKYIVYEQTLMCKVRRHVASSFIAACFICICIN